MAKSRLDTLQEFVAAVPGDAFARYGLAQEYLKLGETEKALAEFEELLSRNAGYSAAYYHGGQALIKLGRIEDARAIFRKGIEVTSQTGDLHARSELQAALDSL